MNKNTHIIINAPFRLDLVMGGVSDLDWWSDKPGECLSVSCDFEGNSLRIEASHCISPAIFLQGFTKSTGPCSFPLSIFSANSKRLWPRDYSLVISSITVANEIMNAAGKPRISLGGMTIINHSAWVKGMGGSSAVAACIITSVCRLFGYQRLALNEIVRAVARAESLAEIGGGWEDSAGVFFPGINHIVYRPDESSALAVHNIPCDEITVKYLQDHLLVVDTRICALTADILNAAKNMFDENPSIVMHCSDRIRAECSIMIKALAAHDADSMGASFTRQRSNWNTITGGMSMSHEVDLRIKGIQSAVVGYREAGAGGGGTVLIMCAPQRSVDVKEHMLRHNCDVRNWIVSSYGLSNS